MLDVSIRLITLRDSPRAPLQRDAVYVVRFIQRCSGGAVDFAVDGEVDVLELEGLSA